MGGFGQHGGGRRGRGRTKSLPGCQKNLVSPSFLCSQILPSSLLRNFEPDGDPLSLQRNYRFFLSFLLVTTVLDCIVFAFCWVRLVYLTQHGNRPNLGGAIKQEPACMAVLGYCFLAFWWASPLLTCIVPPF